MKLLEGDCVERMAELAADSIDAIVCDPPYMLGFMGKAWDTLTPGDVQHGHDRWALQAFRVLKPGGHLLAFGGTRTYHRLACAIEDAGFEIRDSLLWLYGSGFPKSLDVSKAIDKAAGAEREVVETRKGGHGKGGTYSSDFQVAQGYRPPYEDIRPTVDVTAPATPEAQQWQGWGTALKPAHEPIVVARKPLAGTVAANVLAHGTGALNVDGCRVGMADEAAPRGSGNASDEHKRTREGGLFQGTGKNETSALGRWPANVILSPDSADELDRQSGELVSGANPQRRGADGERAAYGDFNGQEDANPQRGIDRGGASRFFYCAKASRGERNAGLDSFEARRRSTSYGALATRECQECGSRAKPPGPNPTPWPSCGHEKWEWVEQREEALKGETRNIHPTVKPIDLMRWLVRLVTPPGGTVLDPFTGSGTTGVAATLEGFDFVGIEREAEYAAIARARIEWWSRLPAGTDTAKALGVAVDERVARETGQTPLFP